MYPKKKTQNKGAVKRLKMNHLVKCGEKIEDSTQKIVHIHVIVVD